MAVKAIHCKHRVKYGFFIFGKYRCEERMPGRDFIAKKAICRTCRGPEYEEVHDCLHYRIGTVKKFADRNAVTVTEYCFLKYKEKDFIRNEIQIEDRCGPKCRILEGYIPRPKPVPVKPSQEQIVIKPAISLGLKVWTILPAIFLLLLAGISEFAGGISQITGKDNIINFILGLGLFGLSFFIWRGKKWVVLPYELLLFSTGFVWALFLFIYFTWNVSITEFLEGSAIGSNTLYLGDALIVAIIIAIVIFIKLPKIKAVYLWQKSRSQNTKELAKYAIISIIVLVVLVNLATKNFELPVSPPPKKFLEDKPPPITTPQNKKKTEIYPVTIYSNLSGAIAIIYKNNTEVRREKTPRTIYLPTGNYKLELILEGYPKITKNFEVNYEKIELRIDFPPSYGTLQLTVSPGAFVYIDGSLIKEVPPELIQKLRVGEHTLTLKRGEDMLLKEKIFIPPDGILGKNYIFGILRINSNPSGILFIDGREYGEVPPAREILLLQGNHILELKEVEGIRKKRESININPLVPLDVQIIFDE